MNERLDTHQLQQALRDLNARATDPWSLRDTALHKEFRFANFARAFAFMGDVARLAEAADHHPDWCNSYNRVTIDLTTHQVGALTTRDFELASAIETLLHSP
jgi:4a-hydroxytetrahydrobiopterin dehydratase